MTALAAAALAALAFVRGGIAYTVALDGGRQTAVGPAVGVAFDRHGALFVSRPAGGNGACDLYWAGRRSPCFAFARFARWECAAVCASSRPAAFEELHRVLGEGGRFVVATFEPAYFPRYYLNEFFLSFLAVDLARFPSAVRLGAQLRGAGFTWVDVEPFEREAAIGREEPW